jgi:hypothetical protein
LRGNDDGVDDADDDNDDEDGDLRKNEKSGIVNFDIFTKSRGNKSTSMYQIFISICFVQIRCFDLCFVVYKLSFYVRLPSYQST